MSTYVTVRHAPLAALTLIKLFLQHRQRSLTLIIFLILFTLFPECLQLDRLWWSWVLLTIMRGSTYCVALIGCRSIQLSAELLLLFFLVRLRHAS